MEAKTVIPGQGELGPAEGEKTVLAGPTTCPVCGTGNPGGTEWCEECGFLLSSAPEEVAAQPPFAHLVDTATGAEYPLKQGENTVGRGASDIVLAADNSVSRSHANMIIVVPNIFLEDLGSTNGTFLNGEKVEGGQRVPVASGDQIRFASTTLEVVAPEAAEVKREGAREVMGGLEVVSEEGKVGSFKIFRGENAIGRHPSNDVPLSFDGYTSGRHAKITGTEEGVFIEDLNSTNGTELNGRRLAAGVKEPLSDGDEVKMGKTVLKFKRTAEGAEVEATKKEEEITSDEGS
jgi:pSer/pThr/pTyr-binding forkhead associated (FHA) protein